MDCAPCELVKHLIIHLLRISELAFKSNTVQFCEASHPQIHRKLELVFEKRNDRGSSVRCYSNLSKRTFVFSLSSSCSNVQLLYNSSPFSQIQRSR